MIGIELCPRCDRATPHTLVASSVDPVEAARVLRLSPDECQTAGLITWACSGCGRNAGGAVERLLVELAVLGLDPQPARAWR